MSEKEINSKWESLKRAENAIIDDIIKIRDRRRMLETAHEEFDYVHTYSGWKKVKSKKEYW